jgi:hypothetical protein
MGALNYYLWTAPCCRSRLEPTQEKHNCTEYRQTDSQPAQATAGPWQGRQGRPCQSTIFFFLGPEYSQTRRNQVSLDIDSGQFADPPTIFPITPSSFPSTLLLRLFSSYTVPTVNSSLPAACFRVVSTSDPAVPLLLHTINREKSYVGRIFLSTTSLPQSLFRDREAVRVGLGKET